MNLSGVQGLVQYNVFNGVDIGVLVANSTGNLTIDSNTFENLTRGATEIASGSFAAGIAFFDPDFVNGPITVSNNQFLNSDMGIRTSNGGGGPYTLSDSGVSLSGNTFTRDLYDIVDKFAGTLTPAGSNVFDGVTLSDATTIELFGIEGKIVDAVDVSGYGLVRLKADNIYVTPNSFYVPGGTTTPSIQRGINAASAGNTVNVEGGAYVGQVVVTENLTLQGTGQSGPTATIIESPTSLPAGFISSYNGAENHPVVYASGAQVNIADLTVNGDGQGGLGGANGNYRFEGVGYLDASGSIDGVTIENVGETPVSGDQQGISIFVNNDDAVSRTVNISGDTIFAYQKGGITFNGAGLSGDISGNTVTGIGPTSLLAQNGIQVSRGDSAIISDNTVDGNSYTLAATAGSSDYAAGILLYQPGAGTTVTGNTVSGNDAGIFLDGAGATGIAIEQNTVENNAKAGIYLTDAAGGATVSQNLISENPIGVVVDAAATNVGAIQSNSFTGNTTAGLENNSAATVDASGNWWGSINGPTTALNTYANTLSLPMGDKVVGTATVAPWLNDGNNYASPGTPGFQPGTLDTSAPVVTLPVSETATEGESASLNLGSFTDDDSGSTSSHWVAIINWNDGSALQFIPESTYPTDGDLGSLSHTFAAYGTYNPSVTVVDQAGNADSASFQVAVADAPLTVTAQIYRRGGKREFHPGAGGNPDRRGRRRFEHRKPVGHDQLGRRQYGDRHQHAQRQRPDRGHGHRGRLHGRRQPHLYRFRFLLGDRQRR